MITDCSGFSSTASTSTASSGSTASDALTLTTTAASSWCALPASTRLRVLRLVRPPHARRLLVAPDRPASFGFAVRGGREYGTGFFVSSVERNSEADLKGLRAGDQILRINGYRVDDAVHKEFVQFAAAQDRLTLKVRGVGMLPVKEASDERLAWHVVKLKSVSNTPSEQSYRCKDVTTAAATVPLPGAGHSQSHTHTINVVLNVAPRTKLGLGICKGPEWKPGIFVQFTKEKSVAREAGLRPGDQLLSVNSIDFSDVLFSEAVAVMKSSHKLEMIVRTAAGCDLFPGESSGYNSSASSVTGDQSPCWADAKSKRLTAVREEPAACIYGELRRHTASQPAQTASNTTTTTTASATTAHELNKTIIKLSDTGTSINNTYIANTTSARLGGGAAAPPPPPPAASSAAAAASPPQQSMRQSDSHYAPRPSTVAAAAVAAAARTALLVDGQQGATLPLPDGRRRVVAAPLAQSTASGAATTATSAAATCRNGRNHHHNANDACNSAAAAAAATAAGATAATSLSDAITEALKKRQEKQRLNAALAAACAVDVDGGDIGNIGSGNGSGINGAAPAGDISQRNGGSAANCGNRARNQLPGTQLRRQVSSPVAAASSSSSPSSSSSAPSPSSSSSSSVLVQQHNCSVNDGGGGGGGGGGVARATSSAANCNSSNGHHHHHHHYQSHHQPQQHYQNCNNIGGNNNNGSQVVGDQHSALMDEFKRAHQRMFRHGFHETEPRKERQEALRRTAIMEDEVSHRSCSKDRPTTVFDRQLQPPPAQPQQQHIPPPPPQFANSPPKVNANGAAFRSLQRPATTVTSTATAAAMNQAKSSSTQPKAPQSPVPDYDKAQLRGTTMPAVARATSSVAVNSGGERRTVRLGAVVIGEYDQQRRGEQRDTPGRFDFGAAQKRNTFDPGSLQAELQSTLSRGQLRPGKEHQRSNGAGSTGTGTGTGILKNGNRNGNAGGGGGGGSGGTTATKSTEKTITFGN